MPSSHHSPPGTPGLSLYARARHGLLVALCVAIYYSSSAAANNWNKWLVELHAPPGGGPSTPAVTPTVLTLLHLLIALSSDIVIMRRTGDMVIAAKLAADSRRTLWDVVHTFAPIAVCVTLSKLTTYLSYQYVSIALAHTAKASEPIFNVIVAALLFGEWHRRNVYLSLIPITLGIALASMSDFSYNHTGFLIAVSSALMKVLQNIATKRVMDTGRFTFWEIHAYCGAASLLVLTPLLLWESWHSGGRTMWAWALALARLPLLALAFDSLLQWASSVSAYWVLSLVSHLSATIINVLKRLLMILAGIWAAAAAGRMSLWNLAGVVLAISGVLWYNLVVAQQDQDAKAALESSSGGGGGGSSGGGAPGATATALPAGGAGGGSGSGAGEDAELEASHLLGMSGIGGLALGGGGASGGGLRSLAAAAGATAGLPSIDEEEGGLRSSGLGEGAAEEAKPRGSSSSIVSNATGAVSRRGSSFEGPGGGGGGGGGGGSSSSSSASSASASGSHLFSAAVHSARTLGVPRSLLVSLGLIPPQVLRGNERRSSSGDWTGSAGARPAVGLLGGGCGGAGSGAGSSSSSSSADISASGEAQALIIGSGSSGGVVGGGGEARLGAAAAAGASSSGSGGGSSSISSSGSGGGAGSGSGSSGVGLLPHPAGVASSGASLFSPLGVPSAAPVALGPGAGAGVSPALGSLVRRPLGVPVIKL